jgi:hypothetical protein
MQEYLFRIPVRYAASLNHAKFSSYFPRVSEIFLSFLDIHICMVFHHESETSMTFTKPSKTIQTSFFPITTTPTSIADFVNPETYESDLFSPFYDFSPALFDV